MSKTVHVHIGPHKTGSTAIQHQMRAHREELLQKHGFTYLDLPEIKAVAQALQAEDEAAAKDGLSAISAKIGGAPGDCLLSCEDWAGDLPGRSGRRRVYPRLWANIKVVRQALAEFDTRFYFFVRDPDTWIRSAYVQHLRFRHRFSRLEDFTKWLDDGALWDGVLARPRARLGEALVEVTYRTDADFSSEDALLSAVLGHPARMPSSAERRDPSSDAAPPGQVDRRNRSPSDETIRFLELVNASAASNEAKRTIKQQIHEDPASDPVSADRMTFPQWPPQAERPDWLAKGLAALWERVETRVSAQDQSNLLPDPLGDLRPLRTRLVDATDDFPEGGRGRMENQVDILRYRFRGLPETCLLNGLVISYLRRGTAHTEHAAYLFQRLWAEEFPVLLATLPTRWLISVFQTFMDHGANEAQRQIGTAAYFLTNTIKLYEAERAIEGLPPNADYPGIKPQTRTGFRGLDRFPVGGTDLLLNMNALMLELASRDAVAGRVVQEFYLRLKSAQTVFSRMDRNRIRHDVQNPQFANCWSFFEPPGD